MGYPPWVDVGHRTWKTYLPERTEDDVGKGRCSGPEAFRSSWLVTSGALSTLPDDYVEVLHGRIPMLGPIRDN